MHFPVAETFLSTSFNFFAFSASAFSFFLAAAFFASFLTSSSCFAFAGATDLDPLVFC